MGFWKERAYSEKQPDPGSGLISSTTAARSTAAPVHSASLGEHSYVFQKS